MVPPPSLHVEIGRILHECGMNRVTRSQTRGLNYAGVGLAGAGASAGAGAGPRVDAVVAVDRLTRSMTELTSRRMSSNSAPS